MQCRPGHLTPSMLYRLDPFSPFRAPFPNSVAVISASPPMTADKSRGDPLLVSAVLVQLQRDCHSYTANDRTTITADELVVTFPILRLWGSESADFPIPDGQLNFVWTDPLSTRTLSRLSTVLRYALLQATHGCPRKSCIACASHRRHHSPASTKLVSLHIHSRRLL